MKDNIYAPLLSVDGTSPEVPHPIRVNFEIKEGTDNEGLYFIGLQFEDRVLAVMIEPKPGREGNLEALAHLFDSVANAFRKL